MDEGKFLLIKNLSGGFNDVGIGHEIINSFDRNDNDSDYYYIYVPPYGTIGKEDKSFFQCEIYKNIKTILIFDSTNITNILKLKAVVKEPICFESYDEMKKEAKEAKYGPNNKALTEINFVDDESLNNDSLDEEKKVKEPFLITYKVKKSNYYNLEKENIFIWHASSKVKDDKKQDSINKLKFVYGENVTIKELDDIKLGQKNHFYNLGDKIKVWFEDEIEKTKLIEKNIYKLPSLKEKQNYKHPYDRNNILEFLNKINDENIYTNFIYGVLKSNKELLNLFFVELVKKYFSKSNYNAQNVKIFAQKQALIESKRAFNSYLKIKEESKSIKRKKYLIDKCKYDEKMFDRKEAYPDGQMDLYIYDDNYRFVIENKILSGINGKRETIDGQINQLNVYRTYIDDLNEEKVKGNKVILLVPNHIAANFYNYSIEYGKPKEKHRVPVLTYKELAEFFEIDKHKELINEKYRSDFLNILYKQSFTKEEEIANKFINTLNK